MIGVLINYHVLGESKVIQNTTLAASTSSTQFKTVISKLMGSQDPDEMSLAYQISISVAKPPIGISTAIDEAKDYLDTIHFGLLIVGWSQAKKKGKAGVTDLEDASKNEASGNLEFMGEVCNHFPCMIHRSGHPCYPTAEGCHRFTSAQLSFWKFLAVHLLHLCLGLNSAHCLLFISRMSKDRQV